MAENSMNFDETTFFGSESNWGGSGSYATLGSIDQYELKRELGGGGFGTVYLAKDTVSGVDVAVKGLPPFVKNNREELDNIRANFNLVHAIHHPHIAAALYLHPARKVVYLSEDVRQKLRVLEGDMLLVMAYAPGITLSQWRKQFPGSKVPAAKAAEIARQIADALDYAHDLKVIHRDVKPANVMIETDISGRVTARVLDFGLAAEIRSSMGRVSKEVHDTSGTRPYMAPEQWLGGKQGPATDQYALAVLFHELVTGEVPFASVFHVGDPVVMMNVVGREDPVLPSDMPKSMRRALAKALAKKPEQRFSNCREFVDALEGNGGAFAAGVPSGALSGLGRPVKMVAGAAAVALAAGLAWYGLGRPGAAQSGVAPSPAPSSAPSRDSSPAPIPAISAECEAMAELPAFRLSSKAESAHELIAGESAEIREFFAAEIRAFENDRTAGDEAKKMSRNVIATNLYTKALASATALKALVTGYKNVGRIFAELDEARRQAQSVSAEETLPTRFKEVELMRKSAADEFKNRRFDKAVEKAQAAAGSYAKLRSDIIQVALGLAEDHRTAKRWQQCQQEAEKVLGWESGNARALQLKKEASENMGPSKTQQALAAFRAKRWEDGLRLSEDADRDDRYIQFYIGVVYDNGYGVKMDKSEAAKWYLKAAEQGEMTAQYNLGLMYAAGRGVTKDDFEAVKWYRRAADQGYVDAQCNLGFMYDKGRGVPQSDSEALKWYRKAAEAGSATAEGNLGLMYENGQGVAKDEYEAVKWYRKAAEKGNAPAQKFLGVMYEFGTGVTKDVYEAVRWYRKSADQGYADAQCNLGVMYKYGKGTAKDLYEAVGWFRKAAMQGQARAQYNLGRCYDKGEGVAEDDYEAVKWYRKAAEQGYADAQCDLGFMYDKGRGVVQSDSEALKWYRKAAEGGSAVAQCNLGVMYENGQGVTKDDYEAVKWYRKAAEQGNATAQCYLGVMYDFGKGVGEDDYEAVKWYRKAAEQGHARAQHNLGASYAAGEGVVKSESEAIKWFRKAAAQGYERAKKALAKRGL